MKSMTDPCYLSLADVEQIRSRLADLDPHLKEIIKEMVLKLPEGASKDELYEVVKDL